MNDLELLNMLADIEKRRAAIKEEIRRLERWQSLATGIVLLGIAVVLLAGALK